MSKILPLYIVSLIFAYLSHRASVYDYRLENYEKKDRLFYSVVVVCAVVFAGLRTYYNDTAIYIAGYNNLDVSSGWFSRIDWAIGEYPLFSLTSCLMKLAGFSSQSFVMMHSIITMGVSLWFIHKYTNNILLSVFLYFATGYYGFSMAAMKQCAATAFCLIGIDRLLSEKRFSFFFWTIIGVLFHPFAAMFLICPFLMFSPWTFPTYLMIIICAVAGYTMQIWLSDIIGLLVVIGVDYDVSLLGGEGVNIFRVLVVWAPVMLSFLAARFWRISRNKADNLIMNLAILCAEIMLIALFGNPVYFGRLANYFLIFQIVSIPLILNDYEINSQVLLRIATVMGYTGYAIYDNLLNRGTFDSGFYSITIWQYLNQLL